MMCNNFEISNFNIHQIMNYYNLLDLAYSSLICHKISQSSIFELLKVRFVYYALWNTAWNKM